jgi:hypothetical protein
MAQLPPTIFVRMDIDTYEPSYTYYNADIEPSKVVVQGGTPTRLGRYQLVEVVDAVMDVQMTPATENV